MTGDTDSNIRVSTPFEAAAAYTVPGGNSPKRSHVVAVLNSTGTFPINTADLKKIAPCDSPTWSASVSESMSTMLSMAQAYDVSYVNIR